MPEFPCGMQALNRFLDENTRLPIILAGDNFSEDRIFVQFIVNTDGSITDIQVARSRSPALDREAVRAVESMPNWIPGVHNGERVRVRFTLPISFRLQ